MMSPWCRAYQGRVSHARGQALHSAALRSETGRRPLGIVGSAVGHRVGADSAGWGQGLSQPCPCLSCLCDLELIVSLYGIKTEILHRPWPLTGHQSDKIQGKQVCRGRGLLTLRA